MIRKLVLLLAVFLLTLTQIPFVNVAASDGATEMVAARAAAQRWVEGRIGNPVLPLWKGATVGDGVVCHNLDGNVIAYLFSINNAGKPVGYAIVGSSAYSYTVFETGSVAPPTVDPASARAAIVKLGLQPTDADVASPVNILFTGIDGLWNVYQTQNHSAAVNYYTKTAMLTSELKSSFPTPQELMTRKHSITAAFLLRSPQGAPVSSLQTESTSTTGDNALGMSWYTESGRGWCGPCSGVSIGRYYRDQRSFTNLYSQDWQMYDSLLVNMHTDITSGATSPSWYGSGFVTMTEECGYSNCTDEDDAWITFDDYWYVTDDLDSGFPAGLLLVFEWHWVAIKGYWYDRDAESYYVWCTDSYSFDNWRNIDWTTLGGPTNATVCLKMYDYSATTSFGQDLSPEGVVQVNARLEGLADRNGTPVSEAKQISYNAKANYKYSPADSLHVNHGLNMVNINPGDYPFNNQPTNVRLNQSPDGYQSPKTTWVHQASTACTRPIVMSRMIPVLTGSLLYTQELKLTFDAMRDLTQTKGIAQSPVTSYAYKRGDAQENGIVNIFDSMFIAQYIVGNRPLSDLNALNAACPKHDGASGDKIDVFDAMFISQYIVGSRNDFFETIGGAQAQTSAIGPAGVTVSLKPAEFAMGKSTAVPLVIKGIPKDSSGLGCYNIEVVFDSKMARVDKVVQGNKAYTQTSKVSIEGDKTVVRIAGFQNGLTGPSGDVHVADLHITPLTTKTTLASSQIVVKTLGDPFGNNILVVK